MNELITGNELIEKLAIKPFYNEDARKKSASERLSLLQGLNNIYIPSDMSIEIYSKLYFSLWSVIL